MGAALTQRPELFACGALRGAAAGHGPLPPLRQRPDLDPRVRHAPSAEAEFKWLYAYSPYQHVKQGTAYPALLMLASDHDDRVDPMHARKFMAAVQNASGSGAPVLLRVERNAGHGGADMVKQWVQSTADQYAFVMERFGMLPAAVEAPEQPAARSAAGE